MEKNEVVRLRSRAGFILLRMSPDLSLRKTYVWVNPNAMIGQKIVMPFRMAKAVIESDLGGTGTWLRIMGNI